MVPLQDQFFYFVLTITIGMVAGLCYDLYKVIRGTLGLRKMGTALGDILFWLILTGIVFILLLLGNWGEVRLYVLLGLALGAILYINIFSRRTTKLIQWIFKAIYQIWRGLLKTISFIWGIICLPFKGLYLIITVPLVFLVNIIGKGLSMIKKILARLFRKPLRLIKGGIWHRITSIFPIFEYKKKE
ncbi:spore cortex biosynthesis protein YabQ [Desulfotomaculum sp. 1211_IL3151]|uniref:spore cortex biosynthesis protein YabQ n=1 Tax=Desulfotomaculum sp. 1211_IL3151 TaxID=3084055 RepID=UPI002FD9ABD0